MPVAPILRLVRARGADCLVCREQQARVGRFVDGCGDHTYRNAAELYVRRWGGDVKAALRCLDRWRSGAVATATLDHADRWAIALGSHLALLYPELYE